MHDDKSADDLIRSIETRLAYSPYQCLGVAHTASDEDVRTAFLELNTALHPRAFKEVSPGLQHRAALCYHAIREVYWNLRTARDTIVQQTSIANQNSEAKVIVDPDLFGRATTRRLRPLRHTPS